jgi:predicted acylesterase/phospholipase RssA
MSSAGMGLVLAALVALPQPGMSAPRQPSVPCPQVQPDGDARATPNCTPRPSTVRAKRTVRPASPAAAAKPDPYKRTEFTAQEQEAAAIPGIPDARFWADSDAAFRAALGRADGPWLALSAGGADSAFGAGLLSGLTETGRRLDYAVVTGVSSGALLAPLVFLGPSRDSDLKRDVTSISAPDVFEDRRTPESLFDTWPLRELIAKRVTPQLLADVAAVHRAGRRLIVITTNIDAGRPVAWNMGAIAAAGTDAALKLFRDVLLASSAIPGLFPPVLIEAEAGGKRFQEMHADGGLAATIYVAPDSYLLGSSTPRLPTNRLTVLVNGKLVPEFAVTDRSVAGILGRSLSLGVKRATRSAAILIAAAAQRSGTDFTIAYVEQGFDFPSRGLFDPAYMAALFEAGATQGRSSEPFRRSLPEAAPPAQPHAQQ